MDELKLKKVAAYCRVSTEKQADEQTIDVQKRFLQEWADANNAIITQWYLDDGWSGDTLDRPELDNLRSEVGSGIWDAVVFIDRDRLARTLSYQEYVIRELLEKTIDVIFLNNPLAEDKQTRVLQQMYGIVAEMERINIAERMRKGKIHKAKSGKLIGHQAPYGYKYQLIMGTEGGFFKVCEPEAEIVRMIFHWVADEGYSMRRVVKELYELGIKPPKGKRDSWPKSSIARMLNREDYIGISYYNRREAVAPRNPIKFEKYRRVKKSSRRKRPRDEWIAIPVPRIIDDDLFHRAKQRMLENFLYGKRNKQYEYLLTGKVMCACGAKRVGDGVREHHYYRCAARIYNYPVVTDKCKYEGVNAEILDAMTWNKLLELLSQKSLIKSQAQKWGEKQGKTVDKSKEGLTRLKSALEKLTDEEKRYTRAFASKLIEFEHYKNEMQEVKAKREAIELEIKNFDERVPDEAVNLDSFEDICDTLYHTLKYAPASDRQEYIRNLIVSIYVGERRSALVNGHIPLLAQAQNVGYEPIGRYRRSSERREIHTV
ncbi:MAG: Resolvase domain protein [Candidatus Roizmanbacteria bacterium GW2011_GWB1_40_7]|uniref:Resolvase domain protein n=2 Tax=Candidatus Roizmaniibacteriota TaxID=1752723 RepID=A0A0G0T359_9BACT|nr:MAG: Resolvase domain protein [Candidatus Roizmanbacteria bacterium GW2011_GWB1_40_7]KKR93323.1 MAG: Resolvase domain protein [Candidatus Roizmanbacteria bacterium GW2011_GWA1_41_13]